MSTTSKDFCFVKDFKTKKQAIIPFSKIDIITEEIDEQELIIQTIEKANETYIPKPFTQIKLNDGKIYKVDNNIEFVWETIFNKK